MIDNQELKTFFFVEGSLIHGRGLYARVKIEEGDYMGTYFGPEAQEDGSHVLWVEHEGGKWEGRDGKNLLRYLNHCGEPHAEFDGFDLYALKDIKKGEEITINYGEEPDPEHSDE
jgi:hypothetical protein